MKKMIKEAIDLREKKERLVLAIMALIIFGFGTYKLFEVGQPLAYGDEFGYWSNSCFFIGQDWSGTTNTISYYSYGYSLLLVPIKLVSRLLEWNHRQMFQTAVVMHAFMLVGGFFLARELCKRYMSDLHWVVRDLACLVVMLYPSYITYSHLTLTEVTLAFLFWLYFYTMMRVTDRPTLANHIGFAALSFYMYIVHQRCLGIVIASVIIVVYMKLLKVNSLLETAAFLGVMCAVNFVHSAIKKTLQNDLYLANEPAGWEDILGYAFNKKTVFILLMAAVCLFVLYLVDKGKSRLVIIVGAAVIIMLCIFLKANIENIQNIAGAANARLSTNDFSGQVSKVLDIFTLRGFLRLLISIAGKWFYLATASGLVICFALWDLGKRFINTLWDGMKRVWYALRGKKDASGKELLSRTSEDIWLFGVMLAWLGTFGICVIYMSNIARVDNLVYGRYHEMAACFLFLYGFYILIHDNKWLIHMAVFLTVYFLVAWMCQELLDELGNSVFELVHCIILGRVFQDGEVPYNRVWEAAAYAVAAAVVICAIIKVQISRFPKAAMARICVALLGAACIWGYMGIATLESYVIHVNQKVERSVPTIAFWIERLHNDEEIYYMKDTRGFRMGLVLQFYLNNKELTMSTSGQMSPDEDAFYVVGIEYSHRDWVQEMYYAIVETPEFALLVPKEGDIYKRFVKYY